MNGRLAGGGSLPFLLYRGCASNGRDFAFGRVDLLGAGKDAVANLGGVVGGGGADPRGEIVEALQDVFGSYTETPVF